MIQFYKVPFYLYLNRETKIFLDFYLIIIFWEGLYLLAVRIVVTAMQDMEYRRKKKKKNTSRHSGGLFPRILASPPSFLHFLESFHWSFIYFFEVFLVCFLYLASEIEWNRLFHYVWNQSGTRSIQIF